MCFSCASFVLFCAALAAAIATGFNTFLGSLFFGLAAITALVDLLVIRNTLISNGSEAEAEPTANEVVSRAIDAYAIGPGSGVEETVQVEDQVDAEDATASEDESINVDANHLTNDNEAEERPTDSKAAPCDDFSEDAPSGGSPDNKAVPSGLESVEGETTQNKDESDAEDADAAEDKDTDNDAHRLTDNENASDVVLEGINKDKFVDTEHHKEIEVENTDYGKDRAGVDDVVEKDTAQISDDDDLGFELVNVAKL